MTTISTGDIRVQRESRGPPMNASSPRRTNGYRNYLDELFEKIPTVL